MKSKYYILDFSSYKGIKINHNIPLEHCKVIPLLSDELDKISNGINEDQIIVQVVKNKGDIYEKG